MKEMNLTNLQRAEVITPALPYIQKYHNKIIVIKYGGNAMISEELKMQVMDDIVAVPVGQTALQFNGMILLNDVSKRIWDCLTQETDMESIVTALTDAFDVSDREAREDIQEFLDKLRKMQLLEE